MPLEIRELIIQAKVTENNTSNGEELKSEELKEVDIEDIDNLIAQQLTHSFNCEKTSLMKELKIWMIEYLEKQNRNF